MSAEAAEEEPPRPEDAAAARSRSGPKKWWRRDGRFPSQAVRDDRAREHHLGFRPREPQPLVEGVSPLADDVAPHPESAEAVRTAQSAAASTSAAPRPPPRWCLVDHQGQDRREGLRLDGDGCRRRGASRATEPSASATRTAFSGREVTSRSRAAASSGAAGIAELGRQDGEGRGISHAGGADLHLGSYATPPPPWRRRSARAGSSWRRRAPSSCSAARRARSRSPRSRWRRCA